jgi:hypothetical protein
MPLTANGDENPRPDFAKLMLWFKNARKGDESARENLKAWFESRRDAMRAGSLARDEMSLLAYFIAESDGERKLGRNGSFGDLPNSPGSVAAEQFKRFQPFVKEIEQGFNKTVEDFMARVNAEIKYVLLDMVKIKNKQGERTQPFVDGVHDEQRVDEEAASTVDYSEWLEQQRALLRRVSLVLPPQLFTVVILKDYCDFGWAQVGQIIGETEHFARKYHTEAMSIIGRNMS